MSHFDQREFGLLHSSSNKWNPVIKVKWWKGCLKIITLTFLMDSPHKLSAQLFAGLTMLKLSSISTLALFPFSNMVYKKYKIVWLMSQFCGLIVQLGNIRKA